MGMAFGISEEDVVNVAARAGQALSHARASEIFGELDGDLVEDAALYFDDMDEQTDAAYDEIRRQVIDLGYGEEVLGIVPSSPKPRLT